MSPTTWASLGEEDQKIFKEVMDECSQKERVLSRQMDTEAVEQLKEQGMTVTYPEKQPFIDAASSLYETWEKDYGKVMSDIRALKTN